jgi:D-beta-D-heptose 7-phosphate kinase/D-beta-D-heptose 1-phosphate adenosyltransferase
MKYKSWQQIVDLVAELRSDGKTVVFTNGCFDIIHAGHIEYLQQAKSLGDILIIGLNSDDSVRRLKGPARPINKAEDRITVLSALEMVDFVVVFEQDTPLTLISLIIPDFLVKGGDWKTDKIVGSELVLASGGVVKSLPFKKGYSTSEILEKLKNEQ